MYNPFSLLSTFSKSEFKYYWFQMGTPTFLVQGIENSRFDVHNMADGITAGESAFSGYRYDAGSVIARLYQSGYLTIKDYDREFRSYMLMFPNEEVKYGFCEFLLPHSTEIDSSQIGFYVERFVKDLRTGNVDSFMERLQSILSSVPYSISGEKRAVTEQTFQMGCFLVFELMVQFTQTEVHSAKGRADAVVWTKDIIYVFEFKLDGTAEKALAQIEDRGYAAPYRLTAAR